MSVTVLADFKATQIARLARQLADVQDADDGQADSLFEELRREVTKDLVREGAPGAVHNALEMLTGDAVAHATLKRVMEHCSQVFTVDDKLYVAIAVPVSVKLKSQLNGACSVWCGSPRSLAQAARSLTWCTGAEKVVFDPRIFRGGDLAKVSAVRLRAYLTELAEHGEGQQPPSIARPCVVTSAVEPESELVFFLAVGVYAPGTLLTLEHSTVRNALAVWRKHVEWALDQSNPLSWQQGIEAEIKADGFLFLGNALRRGRFIERRNRIEAFIDNFEQGVVGVEFYYFKDKANSQIKLLACSNVMTAEFTWPLLPGDDAELTSIFENVLEELSADRIADVVVKKELDAGCYEELACSRGVVWS